MYALSGVGTGGTLQGAGSYLKQKNKDLMIVAVEPDESAVLSGGRPGHHQVDQLTFVAKSTKFDLNPRLCDRVPDSHEGSILAYASSVPGHVLLLMHVVATWLLIFVFLDTIGDK